MFLNTLNSTEKYNFLKLATELIKVDGIVKDPEKLMISNYIKEMQLPSYDFNNSEQVNINKIIEEFKINSTIQTKRIIFFELLALAFVDGVYALEEQTVMSCLIEAFEFGSKFIERAINLQDAYVSVYMLLENLIEKGE